MLPNKAISVTPLPSPSINFSAAQSSFATVNGARAMTLAFLVDATYAVGAARARRACGRRALTATHSGRGR